MAYGLMIKRSRNNTNRPKVQNRGGEVSDGRVDSKIKVSAQQYYERYMTMARESIAMGDRVTAEGFYQHAEHYLRVINDYKVHKPEVADLTEVAPLCDSAVAAGALSPTALQESATPGLAEDHLTHVEDDLT